MGIQMTNRKIIHTTADGLPEFAAGHHPVTGYPMIIKRGEIGPFLHGPGIDPEEFNAKKGVTKAQARAMLEGAISGWHHSAADPGHYAGDVA